MEPRGTFPCSEGQHSVSTGENPRRRWLSAVDTVLDVKHIPLGYSFHLFSAEFRQGREIRRSAARFRLHNCRVVRVARLKKLLCLEHSCSVFRKFGETTVCHVVCLVGGDILRQSSDSDILHGVVGQDFRVVILVERRYLIGSRVDYYPRDVPFLDKKFRTTL